MNEASVSSPFMSELRKRLVPSEVIKHHDGSMIGLCDCSVTYSKFVWWLEFKFVEMKKKWLKYSDDQIVKEIMDAVILKAAAQNELLCRMNICAAGAFYIIWLKKTCVFVVYPDGDLLIKLPNTAALVDWFIHRHVLLLVHEQRPTTHF